MRKLRLYLDTSVISDIDSLATKRGAITKKFFRIVAANLEEFELFISPITLNELNDSSEEKRKVFAAFLKSLPCTELEENQEAENLAWIYVLEDVLSDSHINDLTHVAYAVMARCDYVISWNMRHLVNVRTIARINEVNAIEKFPSIMVATPLLITGEKT